MTPADWFPNYLVTYLEGDVRQLLAVQDLSQVHRFVRKWVSLADTPTLPPLIVYAGTGRDARQEYEVSGWREFAVALAT